MIHFGQNIIFDYFKVIDSLLIGLKRCLACKNSHTKQASRKGNFKVLVSTEIALSILVQHAIGMILKNVIVEDSYFLKSYFLQLIPQTLMSRQQKVRLPCQSAILSHSILPPPARQSISWSTSLTKAETSSAIPENLLSSLVLMSFEKSVQ